MDGRPGIWTDKERISSQNLFDSEDSTRVHVQERCYMIQTCTRDYYYRRRPESMYSDVRSLVPAKHNLPYPSYPRNNNNKFHVIESVWLVVLSW